MTDDKHVTWDDDQEMHLWRVRVCSSETGETNYWLVTDVHPPFCDNDPFAEAHKVVQGAIRKLNKRCYEEVTRLVEIKELDLEELPLDLWLNGE
jgi:hypothetical protein